MRVPAEDRIFYWAILSSALLHAGFLIQWSITNRHKLDKRLETLEVVYRRVVDAGDAKDFEVGQLDLLSQRQDIQKSQILDKKEFIPEAFIGQKSQFAESFKFEKTDITQIPQIGGKKKITLSMIKPDKAIGARHFEYEKRLESKIRSRANFLAGDYKYPPGNVFIAFILNAKGHLTKIKILEERSQANNDMKEIVLRTVKECSPFPSFPDTKLPERTFKVNFIFSGL